MKIVFCFPYLKSLYFVQFLFGNSYFQTKHFQLYIYSPILILSLSIEIGFHKVEIVSELVVNLLYDNQVVKVPFLFTNFIRSGIWSDAPIFDSSLQTLSNSENARSFASSTILKPDPW